jgi:hypothetical protein
MYVNKLKAMVEENLTNLNFEKLCIYRPGLLLNREGKRFIEKLASWMPFVSKCETKHLAKVMLEQGIKINS